MEHQLLNLAGIRNAWQLGGYAGVCGRKVRRNLLIRSGKLSDAAPEDLLRLTGEYGLSTVIDLRSPEETADAPDPQMDGVRMIPIPVLEAVSFSRFAIDACRSLSSLLLSPITLILTLFLAHLARLVFI
jgi:protein-tyrosine phosphatase